MALHTAAQQGGEECAELGYTLGQGAAHVGRQPHEEVVELRLGVGMGG